jgi:hypothetical protein
MEEYRASPGNTKSRPQRACHTSRAHRHLGPTEPTAIRLSRSHLQPGVKSKNFGDRMEKASKTQAIKKLQAELKEEKQAEVRR